MTSSQPESNEQDKPVGQQHGAAFWAVEFFQLPRILFATPYVGLLAWFHGVDVYHRYFSEPGLIVAVYNLFRVLFIFYLFWMVATVGLLLLHVIAPRQLASVSLAERLALGFFTGAGIWHVVMFVLGFLNLYAVPVATVLTLPLVLLAYTPVRATAVDVHHNLTRVGCSAFKLLDWFLFGLIGIVFVALLLTKGLYPGGGHDYFTHYFYYLQTVIKNGGLWPNDVWYHYYYSKGAGLFFLGVLLTDPLAPQLVTFCFMIAAALALYLVSRRIAPGTLWPLVGVILFLGIYISTPGSDFLYSANGGWGDFEKFHEITAALIVAFIWLILEALSSTNDKRVMWSLAAAFATICAVLVDITIAVFIGGILLLLALFYATTRQREPLIICLALGVATASIFFAVPVLNQVTTGLADDQGLLVFWNYANVEKLAQWGALPFVINEYLGLQSMTAASIPWSIDTIIFLIESARLDIIAPLALGSAIIMLISVFRGHFNKNLETAITIMTAVAITFIAIALLFGRAQQVSFYRYASIATAPAIISGIIAWNLSCSGDLITRISRTRPVTVLVLVLCVYFAVHPRMTANALNRGLHFVSGRSSIDAAYTTQYGPSPRGDWSAIYTGARGAYQIVGPGTPIWSLHIHTYCMLPDCLVESYPSFLMTRRWDRVMFGTPEEARQLLQAAHLNYFLFTREVEIRDPLPGSALFSPDNIGRYLGIRWTDGTTTLLTWLGPDVAPLDLAWIAGYRSAVGQSRTVQSFRYERMRQIFARLDTTPHPWPTFRMP